MGHVVLERVRLEIAGRMLLDDLSLEAEPGELIAIVGPNGVGKTTLLRTLAGFSAPAAGSVSLDGSAPAALAPHLRARAVTLIGSDVETPAGTSVRDVVATGRFGYRPWWDWSESEDDRLATMAGLERVGLAGFAERRFDTLSSGERQRAWLALALAQAARLVLLDEPTSHLDPRYALEMLRLMRAVVEGGVTAIVVLHDLNEAAAVADRIAVLGDGRLLCCAPPNDALDPQILERAFGIAFERIGAGGALRVFPRGYADARAHPPTGT
jgi:iron complex transport system ATP-binding protein